MWLNLILHGTKIIKRIGRILLTHETKEFSNNDDIMKVYSHLCETKSKS